MKRNQQDNGWFNNCDNSYEKDFAPLMHTIAYTIHGLLECYKLTQRNDLLVMAKKPSDVLLDKFATGPLSGRYYATWEPAVASTCITGDAQMSLCWMELFRITGERKYLTGAEKMNAFLTSIQYQSKFREIDGAVPSSCPVGGDYFPYGITELDGKIFHRCLNRRVQDQKYSSVSCLQDNVRSLRIKGILVSILSELLVWMVSGISPNDPHVGILISDDTKESPWILLQIYRSGNDMRGNLDHLKDIVIDSRRNDIPKKHQY